MTSADETTKGESRALLAGGVLFLAAVVHAIGPVDFQERRHVVVPDRGGAESTVGLSLARGTADGLVAEFGCAPGGSGSIVTGPVVPSRDEDALPTVLPVVRPANTAEIVHDGATVSVIVGGNEVVAAPLPTDQDCRAVAAYESGVWSLAMGEANVERAGPAPAVSHIRFAGDLASAPSAVTVQTRDMSPTRSPVQTMALLVFVVAAAVLAKTLLRSGSGRRMRAGISTIGRNLTATDFGVVMMIVLWAIVLPPRFDDGWILQRATAYDGYSGATVFLTQTAQMPLGYWVEWFQGQWFGLSTIPIVMRLPNVVLASVSWVLVRWVGSDELGSRPWLRHGVGVIFVLFVGAWGMGFRPEPYVAVLTLVSVLLAIRFVARPGTAVAVLWSVVVSLAVSAHMTGLVAVVPVLVAAPRLVAWARETGWRRWAPAAFTGAGLALLLVTLDSDAITRWRTFQEFRELGSHGGFVTDELRRYRLMREPGFSNILQRTTVVAALAVAIASIAGLRAIGVRRRVIGWTMVGALGVFLVLPSKWPWHFGVLVGVVPLALAVVATRTPPRDRRTGAIQLSVVAPLLVAIAVGLSWAWSDAQEWATFDLRVQEWWVGAVNLLPVDMSTLTPWLVLLGAIAVVVAWRGVSPGVALASQLAIAAVAAVVVVGATFALDVVRTDGWTFAGQSLEWTAGRTCGLGDRIEVPRAGSMAELESAPAASAGADDAALLAGFGTDRPAAFGTAETDSAMSPGIPVSEAGDGEATPWQVVSDGPPLVALQGVSRDAAGPTVVVQWGAAASDGIADLGVTEIVDADRIDEWATVPVAPPSDADRVRLLRRSPDVGTLFTSLLMTVEMDDLEVVADGARVLVSPALATYARCVDVPVASAGVVPTPDLFVLRDTPYGRPLWPTSARGAAFLGAASAEAYVWFRVPVPPASLGDALVVIVSQRYLLGAA